MAPFQEQDKVELNRSKFMRAKVEHSKQIVEGLAMENYDSIAQNAQDLMLLMNESMWNAFQTPEYVAMSSEFKAAAEHLREAAHNKNVDGATLAYFEVTLTCVRCHKYVRRWAKNPK
jgi:cytochrome c556